MEKRAVFIRDIDRKRAVHRLYHVTPPEKYPPTLFARPDEIRRETEYLIASSAITHDDGPEVMIFPANKDGRVVDWIEIDCRRGTLDHDAVMTDCGFTVIHTKEGDNA